MSLSLHCSAAAAAFVGSHVCTHGHSPLYTVAAPLLHNNLTLRSTVQSQPHLLSEKLSLHQASEHRHDAPYFTVLPALSTLRPYNAYPYPCSACRLPTPTFPPRTPCTCSSVCCAPQATPSCTPPAPQQQQQSRPHTRRGRREARGQARAPARRVGGVRAGVRVQCWWLSLAHCVPCWIWSTEHCPARCPHCGRCCTAQQPHVSPPPRIQPHSRQHSRGLARHLPLVSYVMGIPMHAPHMSCSAPHSLRNVPASHSNALPATCRAGGYPVCDSCLQPAAGARIQRAAPV